MENTTNHNSQHNRLEPRISRESASHQEFIRWYLGGLVSSGVIEPADIKLRHLWIAKAFAVSATQNELVGFPMDQIRESEQQVLDGKVVELNEDLIASLADN